MSDWRRPLTAVALSLVLVEYAFPALRDLPYGLTEDDSYFYAQIAYNLARTSQSSFDGVNPTDGYHLAWAGVLAGVSRGLGFFTWDKETHLKAFFAVYLFLLYILSEVASADRFGRILVFLVLAVFSVLLMEGALLAIVALVFLRWPQSRRGHAALFLVPFVRVDASLVPALAILAAPLWGWRPRVCLRWLLTLAAGVGAQLLLRQALFGHPASVSALLKVGAFAPVPTLVANMAHRFVVVRAAILLGLGAGLVVALRTRRSPLSPQAALSALAAFAGCAYVLLHLLLNNNLRSWYFALPFALLFAAVSQVDAAFGTRVARASVVAILGGIVALRAPQVGRMRQDACHNLNFVRSIRSATPPGSTLFQIDGSGYVGFLAERRVVNGDGLMNSHAYLSLLRKDALATYPCDVGARYVVVHGEARPRPGVLVDFHGLVLRDEAVSAVPLPQTVGTWGLYRLPCP